MRTWPLPGLLLLGLSCTRPEPRIPSPDALATAIRAGDRSIALALIQKGAPYWINLSSEGDALALALACGHLEVAKALRSLPRVRINWDHGFAAVRSGQEPCFQWIIETVGPDARTWDWVGFAAYSGRMDLVHRFRSAFPGASRESDALHFALSAKRTDLLPALLEMGYRPSKQALMDMVYLLPSPGPYRPILDRSPHLGRTEASFIAKLMDQAVRHAREDWVNDLLRRGGTFGPHSARLLPTQGGRTAVTPGVYAIGRRMIAHGVPLPPNPDEVWQDILSGAGMDAFLERLKRIDAVSPSELSRFLPNQDLLLREAARHGYRPDLDHLARLLREGPTGLSSIDKSSAVGEETLMDALFPQVSHLEETGPLLFAALEGRSRPGGGARLAWLLRRIPCLPPPGPMHRNWLQNQAPHGPRRPLYELLRWAPPDVLADLDRLLTKDHLDQEALLATLLQASLEGQSDPGGRVRLTWLLRRLHRLPSPTRLIANAQGLFFWPRGKETALCLLIRHAPEEDGNLIAHMERLLQLGARPDEARPLGSALEEALGRGFLQVAERLRRAGADLQAEAPLPDDPTLRHRGSLLHRLLAQKALVALGWLLDQPGLRADVPDSLGFTAWDRIIQSHPDLQTAFEARNIPRRATTDADRRAWTRLAILDQFKAAPVGSLDLARLWWHTEPLTLQDLQTLTSKGWPVAETLRAVPFLESTLMRPDLLPWLQSRGLPSSGLPEQTFGLHHPRVREGKEAEALLTLGCKPQARDEEGFTPLMRQAQFGHAEVVQALLLHGANPMERSPEGHTALDLARAEYARLTQRRRSPTPEIPYLALDLVALPLTLPFSLAHLPTQMRFRQDRTSSIRALQQVMALLAPNP